MSRPLRILVLTLGVAVGSRAIAAEPGRFEFTTMVAHWDAYGDPAYPPFIEAAQPDVAQLGFYGGHFWSLAHTPQFGGYPAHFPVRGLAECGTWFEERNRRLHERGVKVVGHFNVEFLVGDPDGPEGPRGFFKFYRDLWDEAELGPKPVADPLDLLEKNADGTPIIQDNYRIGGMREYWGCLRNPDWQKVLKAWVKRGVQRGVDGFIANYFYRHNCLCKHCQTSFRDYMKQRFPSEKLREQFGIDDIDRHVFPEIVSWHDPKESTPLRREMLRFSQISNKQVFDEVFIRHGRSLKPDLIVAQWNHLGNFSQIAGDERCHLPAEQWGRDEDYLWYSTGASAHYSDLENRFLGDATLQSRFIRGTFDDKPFTLGKYESTRIRTAISELAANGGAPMGFYTRFTDPAARAEIVRYYQFIKRNNALYRGNQPHSEAVLLFPRKSIHAGDLGPLARFRELGQKLLEAHVLFDVLPDDIASAERLATYRYVVRTNDPDPAASDWKDVSRFDTPFTVRVSASRPANGNELTLHFVNYNRDEPAKQKGQPNPGRGIQDEQPIATAPIACDFVIPAGKKVQAVELLTPESLEPQPLKAASDNERLRVTIPSFLVYGVVRVQFVPE